MSTLNQWQNYFTKNKIVCDTSTIVVPQQRSGTNMLAVVPNTVSNIDVCELFKKKLKTFGLVPFIAPSICGSIDGLSSRTMTLNDEVPHHERSAQNASYAYWVRQHVSEDSGELVLAGHFDHTMTLIEAFWYHLFLMDMCGKAYVDLHFSAYHTCNGSKCSNEQPPSLQWDLQDIKVVLRR